jgi:hypothetical protein
VIADIAARRVSRRTEHVFYVVMSVAAIAIMAFGFAKSFFLASYFHAPAIPLTIRIHGIAFTTWVLLLLVQSTLVSAHRTDIHRKLGWFGAALALFMAGIAVKSAIYAVHRDVVCCNADAARGFLIIPFADVIVFGVLVGYAVAYRRDAATHKRLMLLATLAILDAATSRWPLPIIRTSPYAYYIALDIVILAVVAYDTLVRRHLARAYAWGVPLVIGAHVARELIRATAVWKSFASLLVG